MANPSIRPKKSASLGPRTTQKNVRFKRTLLYFTRAENMAHVR